MSNSINVYFDLPYDMAFYLESSARIRGVSRTQLIRKTIEIILKDQMFLSVLDDDDKPGSKTAMPTGNRGGGRKGRAMPPKDRLFDTLKSRSVPQRRTTAPVREWGAPPKKAQRTKTEMMNDLRQAVLNTGGELVK